MSSHEEIIHNVGESPKLSDKIIAGLMLRKELKLYTFLDKCTLKFNNENELMRQKLNNPTNIPTYTCDICGIMSMEKNTVMRHKEVYHETGSNNIEREKNPINPSDSEKEKATPENSTSLIDPLVEKIR